ncbi:hypothetical protein IHE44_0013563, partial [Lamprotornis superbus]
MEMCCGSPLPWENTSMGTEKTERTVNSLGGTKGVRGAGEKALKSPIVVASDPKCCCAHTVTKCAQPRLEVSQVQEAPSAAALLCHPCPGWMWAGLPQGKGLIVCVCKPGGEFPIWWDGVKFCPGLSPGITRCGWCSVFGARAITHGQIQLGRMKEKDEFRSILAVPAALLGCSLGREKSPEWALARRAKNAWDEKELNSREEKEVCQDALSSPGVPAATGEDSMGHASDCVVPPLPEWRGGLSPSATGAVGVSSLLEHMDCWAQLHLWEENPHGQPRARMKAGFKSSLHMCCSSIERCHGGSSSQLWKRLWGPPRCSRFLLWIQIILYPEISLWAFSNHSWDSLVGRNQGCWRCGQFWPQIPIPKPRLRKKGERGRKREKEGERGRKREKEGERGRKRERVSLSLSPHSLNSSPGMELFLSVKMPSNIPLKKSSPALLHPLATEPIPIHPGLKENIKKIPPYFLSRSHIFNQNRFMQAILNVPQISLHVKIKKWQQLTKHKQPLPGLADDGAQAEVPELVLPGGEPPPSPWLAATSLILSLAFRASDIHKKRKGEKKEPLLLLVCLIKVKFRSVQRQCNWGNVNIPSHPVAFKAATGTAVMAKFKKYIKKTAGSPEERKHGMVLGLNPIEKTAPKVLGWSIPEPTVPPSWVPDVPGLSACAPALRVASSPRSPSLEFPSLRTRSSLQNCSPFSCSVPPPRGLQPWLLTPGAATVQIIQAIIFNYRGKNGKNIYMLPEHQINPLPNTEPGGNLKQTNKQTNNFCRLTEIGCVSPNCPHFGDLKAWLPSPECPAPSRLELQLFYLPLFCLENTPLEAHNANPICLPGTFLVSFQDKPKEQGREERNGEQGRQHSNCVTSTTAMRDPHQCYQGMREKKGKNNKEQGRVGCAWNQHGDLSIIPQLWNGHFPPTLPFIAMKGRWQLGTTLVLPAPGYKGVSKHPHLCEEVAAEFGVGWWHKNTSQLLVKPELIHLSDHLVGTTTLWPWTRFSAANKNIKFLVLPRKRQLIITQYITYQSVVKHENGRKANSCTFALQSLLKDENLLPFPPLNHQGHQNRENASGRHTHRQSQHGGWISKRPKVISGMLECAFFSCYQGAQPQCQYEEYHESQCLTQFLHLVLLSTGIPYQKSSLKSRRSTWTTDDHLIHVKQISPLFSSKRERDRVRDVTNYCRAPRAASEYSHPIARLVEQLISSKGYVCSINTIHIWEFPVQARNTLNPQSCCLCVLPRWQKGAGSIREEEKEYETTMATTTFLTKGRPGVRARTRTTAVSRKYCSQVQATAGCAHCSRLHLKAGFAISKSCSTAATHKSSVCREGHCCFSLLSPPFNASISLSPKRESREEI